MSKEETPRCAICNNTDILRGCDICEQLVCKKCDNLLMLCGVDAANPQELIQLVRHVCNQCRRRLEQGLKGDD